MRVGSPSALTCLFTILWDESWKSIGGKEAKKWKLDTHGLNVQKLGIIGWSLCDFAYVRGCMLELWLWLMWLTPPSRLSKYEMIGSKRYES